MSRALGTLSGFPSRPRRLARRVLGFLAFLLRFLWALVVANVLLAKAVLFLRRENLAPGFVLYPTRDLSKLEILVLSHAITLTPGTTTVEIAEDFGHLVLHAFDARDPDAVERDIRNQLERPILGWTR